MKKSEMIKILANEFVNRGMCSKKMSKLAGKEILTIIEEAGMQPPGDHTSSRMNVTYGITPNWEPEDEKT